MVDAVTGELLADCSPDEARQITERIRSAADALWVATSHLRQGSNPERAGQELVLVFATGRAS